MLRSVLYLCSYLGMYALITGLVARGMYAFYGTWRKSKSTSTL